MKVTVIGAGLAGCEATYQLIRRGIAVDLYEMRPQRSTGAHRTGGFAELVCSNSLKSMDEETASGVLKAELKLLGSLIIEAAERAAIPGGTSLNVDREQFSEFITEKLLASPLVTLHREEVETLPAGPVLVASGPLTSPALAESLQKFAGSEALYFYDAVAPLIAADSIDFSQGYFKARYDKGPATYFNIPLTAEQYQALQAALVSAECAPLDAELKLFEGCMAIEELARRGEDAIRFGPLKPVGLEKPDGARPYAVVQLRQDDAAKSLYSLVGWQTHLKWGEQRRILQMLPGLENARIERYGVIHRNTYLNSPQVLNCYFQAQARADLFIAGQLVGVEGYLESAASGLVAGLNLARYLQGKALIAFPRETITGALAHYIATPNRKFVPMNACFGILADFPPGKKRERRRQMARRALSVMAGVKGASDG